MTPQQIALVQNSFVQLEAQPARAATLFYERLFALDPSTRALFHVEMQEQGEKMMQMLGVAVSNLHQLEAIVPAVQELGARHVDYGVAAAHYDTVGRALEWMLAQILAEQFTPEMQAAWAQAYATLAQVMREAA